MCIPPITLEDGMPMRSLLLLLVLPAFSCSAAADSGNGASAAADARQIARFKPFRNESDQIVLGDLIVENRRDRIELYGSLTITRDKPGLERARALKRLVDAAVDALQAGALPERIHLKQTDSVASPFAPD
jgi:hypothetical protein